MRCHRNFKFTAVSVFRMPLAFCANAVTAVFSSLVVESRHRRRREKGSWRKFPVNATDDERAIVVKITKKQKQKYILFSVKKVLQNGGQNSISDTHFPVWENCILESIGWPRCLLV